MRASPPGATLAWLVEVLGAARVVSCVVMKGGTTSAMHRLEVQSAGGSMRRVVLRRYVLDSYLAAEPRASQREAQALALAATASVPTPGLLAADLDAAVCDAPTIAMGDLAGFPVWDLGRRHLERLVDALDEIHAIDINTAAVDDIHHYRPQLLTPPKWARDPTVWGHAIEIFHGPIPVRDRVFVHRDFHPGNVLWRYGQITGIVDWQAACRGPASIDIAHCRLNLAYSDPGAAAVLRGVWEQRSGRTFDPWADVMTLIGSLDGLRDTPPSTRAREEIDAMLTAAVHELR